MAYKTVRVRLFKAYRIFIAATLLLLVLSSATFEKPNNNGFNKSDRILNNQRNCVFKNLVHSLFPWSLSLVYSHPSIFLSVFPISFPREFSPSFSNDKKFWQSLRLIALDRMKRGIKS